MTKKQIFTLPQLYTEEELHPKLIQMYANIKITLIECITNNPVEFNFMNDFGLTQNQRIDINYSLNDELIKITNNKFNGWINFVKNTVISSIESSLNSLKKLNKINNFTPEEMVEYIYNIIVYDIDDFEHSPCLSDDLLKDITFN